MRAAAARIGLGMPADAFFASGNRGQRIYVVPSERLVLVRLGMTHRPPNFDIVGDILLRDAVAALEQASYAPAAAGIQGGGAWVSLVSWPA